MARFSFVSPRVLRGFLFCLSFCRFAVLPFFRLEVFMSFRSCSHFKSDGVKCDAPALRNQTLCYFHYRWPKRQQRRVQLGGPVGANNNTGIEFPTLESYEDIQVGIMEVLQAIVDDRVSTKRAGLMLYALQIASGNMRMKEKPGLSSRKAVTEIELEEVEAGATAEPPIEPIFTIQQAKNWAPGAEGFREKEVRKSNYEEIDGEMFDSGHPVDRENLHQKKAEVEERERPAREAERNRHPVWENGKWVRRDSLAVSPSSDVTPSSSGI
jgi:hypothetical protein